MEVLESYRELEILDHPDEPDQEVMMVSLEHQELVERQEIVDQPVCKVSWDHQDHQDATAKMVMQVPQEDPAQ